MSWLDGTSRSVFTNTLHEHRYEHHRAARINALGVDALGKFFANMFVQLFVKVIANMFVQVFVKVFIYTYGTINNK